MIGESAKIVGHGKFLRARAQCTIRYTPTTCTITTYEDLDWTDFANIFDLINTTILTHEYGLH
jgi:hypothetical protein